MLHIGLTLSECCQGVFKHVGRPFMIFRSEKKSYNDASSMPYSFPYDEGKSTRKLRDD